MGTHINSFHHPFQEVQFDLFAWAPREKSCLRFFLEQGQYNPDVQAVARLVNICLPCQKKPLSESAAPESETNRSIESYGHISLVSFIRRLVATGCDIPNIFLAMFGEDWIEGIGPIHQMERRNYLFAAKSDTWLKVKQQYDMEDGQTVPFLRPLRNVDRDELDQANMHWSAWLAMQDWMIGPDAPDR